MATIRIRVAPPASEAPRPLGLLLPEPPRTAEQTFLGYEAPGRWSLDKVAGTNTSQHAMLTTAVPALDEWVDLAFGAGREPTPDSVFEPVDSAYVEVPGDLAAAVADLVAGAAGPEERVRRVIDFVAARFEYGARNRDLETPRLVCDIATGNCIDINTVGLAALRAAGIESCYRAGFFFPRAAVGDTADGMHCWLTTRIGGGETHWDVAHCLRTGRIPVAPGLNPAGGMRLTASYGRGLRFDLGGLTTAPISHFARPHWVFPDGTVREAAITTTLLACDGEGEARAASADVRLMPADA